MQPLQYNPAKDNNITHAAAAPSNLDAAITLQSAETELQSTKELRAAASETAAPKPTNSRRHCQKKHDFEPLSKRVLKGKSPAPKLSKSADKSVSQRWCSHSNTIYDVQLQKTLVFRRQPWRQATLMQPWQCDLQRLSCKTQKNYAQRRQKLQIQNRLDSRRHSQKNTILNDFETLFKKSFERKSPAPRLSKSAAKSVSQRWCSHFTQKNTRFGASAFPPTQAPCNIHAAITLRPATESTNAQNHAHMNNHSLQNTEEEPIRPWNDPSRTRRTHEVPFIAGCCHFTRKNTRFRAPAFPPTQAPCNIHAAITLRPATESTNAQNHAHTWTTTRCRTQRGNRFDLETTPAAPAAHTRYLSSPAAVTLQGKTRGFVLRLSHPTQAPCNIHAAITLRPATESTNARNHAHMNNHSLQNTEEPIRPWNDPSRTRRTHKVLFIASSSHFTQEKPGFPPNTSPMQHSCSHYTATCNRVNKRTESRTHEHPLVAELRGTDSTWNDPSRTRRTHEVAFIAGCCHFTSKNTRFRAPAFPPTQAPCNIHAPAAHTR